MQWLINQLAKVLLWYTIKKVGISAFEDALLRCDFKLTKHNKPDGFLHVYEKEGARVTIAECGGLQEKERKNDE